MKSLEYSKPSLQTNQGKLQPLKLLRQDNNAAVTGVTGTLATNGEYTVSIAVNDLQPCKEV